MQHDILSEFRSLVGQQYLDKELDVAIRLFFSGQDLSVEAKGCATGWISNIFRLYEEIGEYAENGLLPSEFWESRHENMKRFLWNRKTQEWWEGEKDLYSSKFQNICDDLIATTPK